MSKTNWDAALALLLAIAAILLGWQLALFCLRILLRTAAALPRSALVTGAWGRAKPVQALLRQRYPRVYSLMHRRLLPSRFDGLPLTLLVVAALYLVGLLGGLVE